jgi:hypothetical protein
MWEYTTMSIDSHGFFGGKLDLSKFTTALNEHGRAGWELVNVFDTNMTEGATRHVIAVFKRPAR